MRTYILIPALLLSCALPKASYGQCEKVLYFKELGLVVNYDSSNSIDVNGHRFFRFQDSLLVEIKLLDCNGESIITCWEKRKSKIYFKEKYKNSVVVRYETIQVKNDNGKLVDYSVDYLVPDRVARTYHRDSTK
jgi:hypothetical protein